VGSADSQEEWAFAGAIVALGRTLGLAIIAEGIEEVGQLERLRSMGCESGQGYLFARPATADAITRFLEKELAERMAKRSSFRENGRTSRDIPVRIAAGEVRASA
jgi:EAL domain-containing protein (putative c-di-GMP-specific phosphodiesterase class I)